jgi:hypothetical protein
LIDPVTVFNVDLSPTRNAARWFSWLMQGVKPENGDELIYTGTEGYAGAVTRSTKQQPIIAGNVSESQNISLTDIARPAIPLFKHETVEFN